jgi:signal peptidase II
MSAFGIVVLTVVVGDQAIKLLLRRLLGNDAFALGPCGSVRVVAGRIWLGRLAHQCSGLAMWCVWSAGAVALVICGALAPLNPLFVGLLLGGSLSHAVEISLRGSITDYICLRNGVVFNLADLALAGGAMGIMGDLLFILQQTLSWH